MTRQVGPSVVRFPQFPRVLTNVDDIRFFVPDLPPERLEQARSISQRNRFRLPTFYARHVLLGTSTDPLLDLVLPSDEELSDGPELWDATPSPYRASFNPFWIQKYEYQGLLRLTTVCSGLCRFCYLKEKALEPAVVRSQDVDHIFDDLRQHGHSIKEIILSGGDPLCSSPDVLLQIAERVVALRKVLGTSTPLISIHTREPVWDPEYLLSRAELWDALAVLQPSAIMFHVLHPREITEGFLAVASRLADNGEKRPALLCQHPVFRGVNDSVEVLEELYERLLSASPPIVPYYIVHPFYNGTLGKHKLSVRESQCLYRELIRRPGWFTPRLVVPTPLGKCVVGPHEQLRAVAGGFMLTTKDGQEVVVP
ncbi:MAG: hypothetical protein ABIQ65_08140 [Thermoanaerobaculia bacterium]